MQINDEDIKLVLSKNIKLARAITGVTQEALAEDSEISVGFLKDIESTRSGVSLSTLITLCKSLNITPNQVLKDFFNDSVDKADNILQQINLLDEYHKDAVLSLINYFNSHTNNTNI